MINFKSQYLFFFLPLVTLTLFFQTQQINPLHEIPISTETGIINNNEYVQINFLDGHNLKIGHGWRDEGYPDGKHIWYGGLGDAKDPFEIYQKAYAPTFGYTNAAYGASVRMANLGTGTTCYDSSLGSSTSKQTTFFDIFTDFSGGSGRSCDVTILEWDISSISVFSTVNDVDWQYDIQGVSNPRNVDIVELTYEPLIAGPMTLYEDVLGFTSDVNYLTDSSCCSSVQTDSQLDLGTIAESDVQDAISTARNWWGFGIVYNNFSRSPTQSANTISTSSPLTHVQLQIVYTSGAPPSGGSASCAIPDAVTNLNYTTIGNTLVGLIWSQPDMNGCDVDGYMINYTTPHSSNPLTIIQPNTGSPQTNYLVNGLIKNTQYSFRVSAINTAGDKNATGNVLNVTTTNIDVPDISVGTLDLNQTNTDVIGITFERINLNATQMLLNVTYPNTYNMSCNFYFKYARTNQTFDNLSYVNLTGGKRESSFRFNNYTNEIIDVRCDDNNSDDFGKYIITQIDFAFLQMVRGFQSGEFGTQGQFGAIDLVTLIIIIASMVGLNRVNETVGAIFMVFIVGALWYFELIELPTVIVSGIALVTLLIITSTRKD